MLICKNSWETEKTLSHPNHFELAFIVPVVSSRKMYLYLKIQHRIRSDIPLEDSKFKYRYKNVHLSTVRSFKA